MTTAQAWEALAAQLGRLDPGEVAARSGAVWDGGRLRLPFFDRAFLISFPHLSITEESASGGEEPSPWLKLLLGRYLASARELPFSDAYLSFRQLPESAALQGGFAAVVAEPLQRLFGHDLYGFRQACRRRGGQPVPDMGDAAFQFLALPRIMLLVILFVGEEDLPAAVNILFDASSQHHLGAEDLFILGEYLSATLREEPGHYLLK